MSCTAIGHVSRCRWRQCAIDADSPIPAAGGLCYYGSNSGLYGELMQFMPRALVFVAIVFFYARLYVFLRRPDKIKASFSNSAKNTAAQQSDPEYTYQSATSSQIAAREERKAAADATVKDKIGSQFAKFSFKKRGDQAPPDEKSAGQPELARPIREKDFASRTGPGSPKKNKDSRSGSDGSKSSDIPPWERLELPAFQIDGQRYGGPSSSSSGSNWPGSGWGKKSGGSKRPTSSGSTRAGAKTPVQKAYPRGRTRSPQGASTTAGQTISGQLGTEGASVSASNPGEQSSSFFSTYSGMAPKTIVTAPSPQTIMEPFAAPSPVAEEDSGPSTVFKNLRPHPGNLDIAPDQQVPSDQQTEDQIGELPAAAAASLAPDILTPSTTASSSRPFIDRSRQFSLEHSQLVSIRRDSAHGGIGDNESRRGSGPVSFVLPSSHKEERSETGSERASGGSVPESSVPDSSTKAGSGNEGAVETSGKARQNNEEEDDDDDFDFAQMLAASAPGGTQTGSRQGRAGSEETEFIQESTASYLNRKTAMLMLYFPLA